MITEVKVERITQSHVRLLVQQHNTLNNTFPVAALIMSNEEVLQIISALQQGVQSNGGYVYSAYDTDYSKEPELCSHGYKYMCPRGCQDDE